MEPQGSDRLLEFRIAKIEEGITKITGSMEMLARLEERHQNTTQAIGRAFVRIEDHETRIKTVEVEMPTIRMSSRWIYAGVVGIIGLLGVTVFQAAVTYRASVAAQQIAAPIVQQRSGTP